MVGGVGGGRAVLRLRCNVNARFTVVGGCRQIVGVRPVFPPPPMSSISRVKAAASKVHLFNLSPARNSQHAVRVDFHNSITLLLT